MTLKEIEALEQWQAAQACAADRRLSDLSATIDDLTSLTHTRNGARVIQANRRVLLESLRRLHDLYQDTQPVESVA